MVDMGNYAEVSDIFHGAKIVLSNGLLINRELHGLSAAFRCKWMFGQMVGNGFLGGEKTGLGGSFGGRR
jgi:hypothetical protein